MPTLSLPHIAALFTLAAPLGAQQSDSATVRVMVLAREAPVAQARVEVASRSMLTDAGGLAIVRVAAGRISIQASRVGFEPTGLTLSLRAGQDTTVTLELVHGAEELEDLVVSVTRSTRRLGDQPVRVEVVGEEEIAEKVLMTPGDIGMLLNETGGLRVQATSPSLGGANVRVQGLRGRYTLMLSDGLPLHGEAAGGPGLLQVPPMDLGQVEVLKGAASALYGGAALGGAINLISRLPTGERDALLNVTTEGGSDAATWISGILSPELGWSLYTGWHRQDRRDLDDDGWTDLPSYQRVVARPRLHYQGARGQALFATLGATIEEREGGTMPGRTAPDGQPWAEANRSIRLDAGVSGRAVVDDQTFLTVRASALSQDHRHRFGPREEPDRHTSALAELSLVRAAGQWVMVGGAALQGTWFRSEGAPGYDFDHLVPGAFGQVEWTPAEAVGIGASLRLDHHSEYGTFASPRLNVVFHPSEGLTARVSGGAGYFGPTPLVEEAETTGLLVLRQAAPLRAERVVGGSADLTWRRGVVELGGTLFASRVRHPVAATPLAGPDEGLLLLANQAEPVNTHGAELLARVHREGLHLTASYTWIRATEQHDGEARRTVPLNPRHALGLVGMYEWEESARVGVELYAVGPQTLDENPYRMESRSYLILGALVEKTIAGGRFFVNFENLTGVRQTRTDPLVRPTRGPGGRWTTDAWAPLEGRVVNGGVRVGW